MINFILGWLVIGLIVSIAIGLIIHIGAHDLDEPRPMKKIRKAGF